MPRIASLVLLGGGLIVLMGAIFPHAQDATRISTRKDEEESSTFEHGPALDRVTDTDDSSRDEEFKAGPVASAGIVLVLTISAISFEALTTVPNRSITILGWNTTLVRFVASHWLGGGILIAGFLWLVYFSDVVNRWIVRVSTTCATISIAGAVYEVFILIPNL